VRNAWIRAERGAAAVLTKKQEWRRGCSLLHVASDIFPLQRRRVWFVVRTKVKYRI
jgi:hypothetical protein